MGVTTTGYGDLRPGTLIGRLIAVALMIYGMVQVEVVTATLASWFIPQIPEEERRRWVRRVGGTREPVERGGSRGLSRFRHRCHKRFISHE